MGHETKNIWNKAIGIYDMKHRSRNVGHDMEKEKETLLELKNRTSPSSPGLEETLLGSPGSALSKVVVNGGESLRKT